MKKFMNYQFDIKRIHFAGFVDQGIAKTSNINRATHLLLFSIGKNTKKYELPAEKPLYLHYNEILYLPAGSSYITRTLPTGSFYMIEFILHEECSLNPFVFAPKDTAKMLNFFSSSARIFKKKDVSYHMHLMSLVYNILATMQTEYNRKYITNDSKSIIAPAYDYIHSN